MVSNKEITLRDRIIDSSRKMLLEEGYRDFSLRKVARRIGVSATSIYLHFDSKDDLIHTLIDESIQKLNTKLAETTSRIANPVERLEALARSYTDFALSNPGEYQIIYFVSSDEMARYPKEKFWKARKGYDRLTQTINEGISKGLMTEENPRIASYIFWAQLHGAISVVLSRRLDTRINSREFIEQAIKHILDGFYIRILTSN